LLSKSLRQICLAANWLCFAKLTRIILSNSPKNAVIRRPVNQVVGNGLPGNQVFSDILHLI
jgi:hypothetical protein